MKKRKNKIIVQPYDSPYSFFPASLRWLNATVLNCSSVELSLALRIVNKILTVLRTRGKPEAIKYCKSLRLKFLTFLLGVNQEFKSDGTSSLPKLLRPIKRFYEDMSDYPFTRLILTSLYIGRFLRLEPKPSFESIEQAPFYEGDVSKLKPMMVKFLNDLGVGRNQIGKVPKALRFKDFHMTSKSGPNGHALWSSYVDAKLLPHSLVSSIVEVGGTKLGELIGKNISLSASIPNFFSSLSTFRVDPGLRKMVVLSDKEGKSREVAVLDYWSQSALRPLHQFLFKILRTINQDCTHDQSKHLCNLTASQGSSFHSVDLTTATDRFPIEIQRELLSVWFGQEYSLHWKNIMVGYPFDYKQRKIIYATGNPMGAYSSWASFAICHHFLVWLACKQTNHTWRKCPYMLLGDDIVIANDVVANEYKKLLAEWCIPYSKEKTHVSKYGYEFAKQIVLHDMNVSPFPLSALYERRHQRIESVGIILGELWRKEWHSDVYVALEGYFRSIFRWSERRFNSFQPKLNLVVSLLSYLQGQIDLGPPVMEYVTKWTGQEFEMPKQRQSAFANWLAVRTCQKLFEESRERVTSNTNNLPLGELALRMVVEITSLKSGGEDCFDLIESVPFLQVYGRAEETFLSLQSDLTNKGFWVSGRNLRDYIGKVDIPLSDTDFYVRRKDVLIIQALKASRIMEDLIKTTPQVVWNNRFDFTLPWHSYTQYDPGIWIEGKL